MTERKRIGVDVDASLWDRFREDVQQRKGGTRGHLREELQNAIREYIHATEGGDTHDRLRRIENGQEELLTLIKEKIDAENCKNKKDSDVSRRTLNRLKKIEDKIVAKANGSNKVHESVIENAIEDVAGGSHPTIRKYKDSLKNRRIALPWPDNKKWFIDGETFVNAHINTFPERYDELTEKYGEEWVESQLNDDTHSGAES